MCIESEAGNAVQIASTQGCIHTGPCLNSYCTCNKEEAGKFEFCCDSCVGFLCPHAFTNMFTIS